MTKEGFNIVYRLTQIEVNQGDALNLSGGVIEIIDNNGQPTGVIYVTGADGVAPQTIATSQSVASAIATVTINDWTPNNSVTVDVVRRVVTASGIYDVGDLIRSNSVRTTRSTFDGIEASNWALFSIDIIRSVAGRIGDVVLAKSDVGLSNVDNTTDISKPVSTAQQTSLNLKANIASPTFTGIINGITKTMVGLTNVDDTNDINKPVSTAQQTALNLKENKVTGKGLSTNDYTTAEQTKLSGIATEATANIIENVLTSTSITNALSAAQGKILQDNKAPSVHIHIETDVTNLVTDLGLKAPIASPAFTGTPTGITKTHIGLSNVDDTSDINKPISTTQQTALNGKEPIVSTSWTAYTPLITTESGAWSNYTITANYRIINKMLEVSFRLLFTGTSSAANGLYISIPSGLTIDTNALKGSANWDTDPVGLVIIGDSGTVSGVPGILNTRTSTKVLVKYNTSAGGYITSPGLTNTTPWTWTTQDDIVGRFTVPII